MSENIKKLNLRALAGTDEKTSPPQKAETQEETMNIESSKALDAPEKDSIKKTLDISSGSSQEKSHNISFADIKKQIDKKNTPSTGTEEVNVSNVSSEPTNTNEKDVVISNQDEIAQDNINTNPQENHKKDISTINNIPEKLKNPEENISHEEILDTTAKIQEDSSEVQETPKDDKTILENAVKTNNILKQKEENSQKGKKSIFSFLKRKKGKEISKKEDNTNLGEGEESPKQETVVEKVHFSNYESHFKKESTDFLKRFQNFKYTPKTRIGMILSLVAITFIGISSLMVMFPEKHSFSIYKASILDLAGKGPIEDQINIPEGVGNTIPTILDQEIKEKTIEKENIENEKILIEERSKAILRNLLLDKYK